MENSREKVDLLIKALYNKIEDMSKYKIVREKAPLDSTGLETHFGVNRVFVSTGHDYHWTRAWSSILSSFSEGVNAYEDKLFLEDHLTIKDICVWIECVKETPYENSFDNSPQISYQLNTSFCIRYHDPLEQWG